MTDSKYAEYDKFFPPMCSACEALWATMPVDECAEERAHFIELGCRVDHASTVSLELRYDRTGHQWCGYFTGAAYGPVYDSIDDALAGARATWPSFYQIDTEKILGRSIDRLWATVRKEDLCTQQ